MKVSISRGPMGQVEIFIFTERLGKWFMAKPVIFDFEEVTDQSHMVKATLTLGIGVGELFLKELSNALGGLNIKPESQSKLEGILEATEFHLKDMRDLVFKKKELK